MALGKDQPKFIGLACINIVVASNAGGAFSPFGDITTLMVWQRGVVNFWEFFHLFLPSVVNFAVPAAVMQFFVPRGMPSDIEKQSSGMRKGGGAIVFLFLFTVASTVALHTFFHIPPVFGMMMGLSYLKIYDYFLQQRNRRWTRFMRKVLQTPDDPHKFSVFDSVAQAEWDTLFFFYGVIMAVGGLGFIGYLEWTSVFMYQQLGPTTANILVGFLSALIDNIPVMFAVLAMRPEMSHEQWLLVTLTAGVGGSMLSVGSAAGVALMGQARGHYTFMKHLRWTPIIALGFGASICTHIWINGL
jgi:Na+/H+ antiporter NhaD/arsenite permease-like protein